jgi:hypothetical protein
MTASPKSHSQPLARPEEEDAEMLDADQEEPEEEEETERNLPSHATHETRQPRETRKDKDLNTFLNSMDRYAPIVNSLTNGLLMLDTRRSH